MKLLEVEQYLRKYNIKVTKGRVNILDILYKNNEAISVESIFEQCKNREINIDLSTVYRSLELFEKKRIIRKFDLGQGKYSYIMRKKDHKHMIKCKLCNKRVEIDCPMQEIREIIKSSTGFTSVKEDVKVNFEGICEECKKEEEKKNRQ